MARKTKPEDAEPILATGLLLIGVSSFLGHFVGGFSFQSSVIISSIVGTLIVSVILFNKGFRLS